MNIPPAASALILTENSNSIELVRLRAARAIMAATHEGQRHADVDIEHVKPDTLADLSKELSNLGYSVRPTSNGSRMGRPVTTHLHVAW